MQMNFQAFKLQENDILFLLPIYSWFYMLSFVSLFIVYYRILIESSESSTLWYFVPVLFLSSFFGNPTLLLAQYPNPGYGDPVHTYASNFLVHEGKFAQSPYLNIYPGAHIVVSCVSLVLNVSIFLAELMMDILFQLLTVTTLFLVGMDIFDPIKSSLLIISILAFGRIFYGVFGPITFAIILLFLFMHLILRESSYKSSFRILMVLISLTLILTHPIISFTLLILTSILTLYRFLRLQHSKNPNCLRTPFYFSYSFPILLLVSWIMWIYYHEPTHEIFEFLLSFIKHIFTYKMSSTAEYGKTVILQGLSYYLPRMSIFSLVSSLYKFATLITFLSLSLISLIRRRKKVLLFFYALLLDIVIIFVLLNIFTNLTHWPYYVGFLLAPTCLFIVLNTLNRVKLYHIIILLLLLFPSFIAYHPPFYIAPANEYTWFIHKWEIHSIYFVQHHLFQKVTISSDCNTLAIYQALFPTNNLQFDDAQFPIWDVMADFISFKESKPTIFIGDIIIRSFRQEVATHNAINITPSFWNEVDSNIVSDYNQVYDNYYTHVYLLHPLS